MHGSNLYYSCFKMLKINLQLIEKGGFENVFLYITSVNESLNEVSLTFFNQCPQGKRRESQKKKKTLKLNILIILFHRSETFCVTFLRINANFL